MKLTKEDILFQTNGGFNFYTHVMSRQGVQLKPNKNQGLKNPFYEDKNGSLSIFKEDNQYLFKDFGDDTYKGDVFQFAAFYYGLDCQTDFYQIMENIDKDLSLSSATYTPPFQISFSDNMDYWYDFADKEEIDNTLMKYSVKSIAEYSLNGYSIKANQENPIYGFQLADSCYKIYRPLEKNKQYKHIWLGKKPHSYTNIYGINQLPSYTDIILIVEGLKDCIVANANGFYAIALDNASTKIDTNTIKQLEAKCKHLILCLDNDSSGRKASKEISSLYGLHKLVLPLSYGKDISDFFFKANEDRILKLNQLIEDCLSKPLVTKAPKAPVDDFEKLLRSKSFLKKNISKVVSFANPIISQNEQGIIHPNTINVIQGKAGVHKSRLVENLCSSLLTSNPSLNFLGYKKDLLSFNNYSVLYVDTERNLKDQYIYALQQIKLKAGFLINQELPNFDFISLIDIARDKRFDTLEKYLNTIREKFDNHIFIVLDVLTDCISNFNDVKESLKLIDMLNVMINNYNVTFLCVIHENPSDGSSKARGHLGTEIMNKASCQMQIGFEKDKANNDTDLIKVKYLKVRVGKKPDPFYLQYSESEKGLVLADFSTVSSVMDAKKNKANLENVKNQLSQLLINKMHRQELINKLMITFSCGERTILNRLEKIYNQETIIVNKNNEECVLDKNTIDRKTYFFLEPINRQISIKND